VDRLPAHMRKDAYATHQLHYQLRYGPFRGKDSTSTASLHQCYVPGTDKLTAA